MAYYVVVVVDVVVVLFYAGKSSNESQGRLFKPSFLPGGTENSQLGFTLEIHYLVKDRVKIEHSFYLIFLAGD